MTNRTHVVTPKEAANPFAGSSLVPMLIIGVGADMRRDDRGGGVDSASFPLRRQAGPTG